jgi:membrane-associated phospholipid phosphatase
MNVRSLIWALIATIGVVDCVLFAAQHMTIAMNWPNVIFVTTLAASSAAVQRFNPPASRLLTAFAQIFAFAAVASYLSYAAMAASPFPLADALLSRADAAIGFDWLAWFAWLKANPALHVVLAKAYASAPLQVFALLLYFAYADAERVDEALLATILSVGLIIPGMVLLPAVGAWSHYGIGVEPWRSEILALRAHTLQTVGTMQGIISFPSFHTVMAIVLANMARGRRWFLPVLVLNVLLIASVMSEGAHYGVDMLAGVAVACVAIGASRTVLAWCASASRREGVPAPPQLSSSLSQYR